MKKWKKQQHENGEYGNENWRTKTTTIKDTDIVLILIRVMINSENYDDSKNHDNWW